MSALVDTPVAPVGQQQQQVKSVYTPARLRTPRPFEFKVPPRHRIGAGIVDSGLILGATVFAGQRWELAIVTQMLIFIALRFVFEVVLLSLAGRTPGRFLFKLRVSESSLWPANPRLRTAFTRHLVKSGDLLFGLIIALTATGASIGSPTSVETFVALVLVIPLTVAAHGAFLASPLVLLASLFRPEPDRPLHDRIAKTYVFATTKRFSATPVKYF